MASRTKQKEEARAQRLAQEQALAAQARRRRQLQTLGGLVVVVAAIIAVVVAITSSGGSKPPAKPNSPAARQAVARVTSLLAGIPQHGNVLGSPSAKVTVTEFGDLECSVCDEFALSPQQTVSTSPNPPGSGIEDQLISKDVRAGKIKLVYRSLETATGSGASPGIWTEQQAAAYDAGLQNKAWDYIELFYNEQQPEDTPYTLAFLEGIARQIPGLNYSAWVAHLHDATLAKQVAADNTAGTAIDGSPSSVGTPTIVASGPRGQSRPIIGLPSSYSEVESEINKVR